MESCEWQVNSLNPAVPAVPSVPGTDFATGFDLLVAIVGIGQVAANSLQWLHRAFKLQGGVISRLPNIEGNFFRFLFFVMLPVVLLVVLLFVVTVSSRRNAVLVFQPAYGQAKETVVKVIAATAAEVAGVAAGIGDTAVRGVCIALISRAARNVQVIPVTVESVEVIGPVAGAAIKLEHATVQVGGADIAVFNATRCLLRYRVGNPVVQHIDHAAYRAATVK